VASFPFWLFASRHMSAPKDMGTRLVMLVRSGTVRFGGIFHGKARALARPVGVFASTDRDPSDLHAYTGPLTGLPAKLASARDGGGNFLDVREVRFLELEDTAVAGGDDAPEPAPPTTGGAAACYQRRATTPPSLRPPAPGGGGGGGPAMSSS
jgi:hypothetical protein